jgi:hypothetical protein
MDENQKPQEDLHQSIVVGGQAIQQETTDKQSVPGQRSTRRLNISRNYYIISGALQLVGVAFFVYVYFVTAGKSGSEFVYLFMLITLLPFLAAMALVNLIGLPFFLYKHRTQGKVLVLPAASLLVSLGIFLYGAYGIYQTRVVMPKQISQHSKNTQDKLREYKEEDQQGIGEISKEEAITMLQNCKVMGFYYTNQNDRNNGAWGELSATGVVSTSTSDGRYRLSVADRLVSELVPIAREAQKTCSGPQFSHDGDYEQWKEGHWYFKGVLVN